MGKIACSAGLIAGVVVSLAGCGLADTATTAAAGGAAKAKELEQARQTQQRAVGQLEQATQQGDQRLREAENR